MEAIEQKQSEDKSPTFDTDSKAKEMDSHWVEIRDSQNENYRIRFSETFILLERDNRITIHFNYESSGFIDITFYFIHEITPQRLLGAAKQDTQFRESGIDIYLTNWYHDQWMANDTPVEFKVGKREYKMQFRTDAGGLTSYRGFSLTIWQKMIS